MGRAWESTEGEDVERVTVAVGIDDPTLVGRAIAADRERLDRLEAENDALRENNERLRDHIEALESRLAAVEGELGIGRDTRPAHGDD